MQTTNSRNMIPFLLSLGLHTTLVAATFLIVNNEEEETAPVATKTVLQLASYQASEVVPKIQEAKPNQEIQQKKKAVVEKEIVKKEVKKVPNKPKPKEIVKEIKKSKTPEQIVQKEKQKVLPAEAFASQVSNEVAPIQEEKKVSRAPLQQETLVQDKLNTPPEVPKEIDPTTLGVIRSMIQNSLIYPSMARRLKIEGVVLINFILTRDGRVKSAVIEERSGSTSLDSKALETVRNLSGTYPKLSNEMQLKIPIAFSLKQS